LITDELNVREVELVDLATASEGDFGVKQSLQVNARAAGPRLGRDVQQAIKGSKTGDWSVAEDGTVVSGGITLVDGEFSLQTVVSDTDDDDHRAVAMLAGSGFVILDTEVTAELAAEGLARDLVRAVQQERRTADLQVSDRINLTVAGSAETLAAVQAHAELIKTETLTEQLELSEATGDGRGVTVGDNQTVALSVSRV
jgi:isoleucyl-tRNA synthetase